VRIERSFVTYLHLYSIAGVRGHREQCVYTPPVGIGKPHLNSKRKLNPHTFHSWSTDGPWVSHNHIAALCSSEVPQAQKLYTKPSALFLFIPPNPYLPPVTPSPHPSTPTPRSIPLFITNLLLQHNTIHTSLQQRKHKTSFPLQPPQGIEDFRRRIRGKIGEEG